jgi:hypothetical protein
VDATGQFVSRFDRGGIALTFATQLLTTVNCLLAAAANFPQDTVSAEKILEW